MTFILTEGVTTVTRVDDTLSIPVVTPSTPKRTGLIKVKRDVNDMQPRPISALSHHANDWAPRLRDGEDIVWLTEQPQLEWGYARGDVIGLVATIVVAATGALVLGWIIVSGVMW